MASSIRSTAKVLGIAESTLRKAIARGTVTKRPDGTLDPAQARRQYARNVRPKIDGANGSHDVNGADYNRVRTAREVMELRIAELSYKKLVGEVVPVVEVQADAFEAARVTHDALTAIGARIAPIVAAIEDPAACQKVIDDEVRRVCEHLVVVGNYKPKGRRPGGARP